MRFESRTFKLAKDSEHPEQNQDACLIDTERGIAAIADGVASGIFSRQWAAILTEAVVADAPDPQDQEAFKQWLAEKREIWQQQIDVSSLAWFQKPKLREGAFSTLLWLWLADDEQDAQTRGLHCLAIGDTCMFFVRDGQVRYSFPIQTSEELVADPIVIGSIDLNRDAMLEFQSLEDNCSSGDLLVLCTDAVADWALRLSEAGTPPAWEDYWEMTEEAWQEEVADLRAESRMRYDDATLVLLRVCPPGTVATPAPSATAQPESPPETDDYANELPAAGTVPGDPEPVRAEEYPIESPVAEPDDEQPIEAEAVREPRQRAETRAGDEEDWREKVKTISEQVTEQVTEQVSRGLEKLKKMKESAQSALEKYRDKLRDDK